MTYALCGRKSCEELTLVLINKERCISNSEAEAAGAGWEGRGWQNKSSFEIIERQQYKSRSLWYELLGCWLHFYTYFPNLVFSRWAPSEPWGEPFYFKISDWTKKTWEMLPRAQVQLCRPPATDSPSEEAGRQARFFCTLWSGLSPHVSLEQHDLEQNWTLSARVLPQDHEQCPATFWVAWPKAVKEPGWQFITADQYSTYLSLSTFR